MTRIMVRNEYVMKQQMGLRACFGVFFFLGNVVAFLVFLLAPQYISLFEAVTAPFALALSVTVGVYFHNVAIARAFLQIEDDEILYSTGCSLSCIPFDRVETVHRNVATNGTIESLEILVSPRAKFLIDGKMFDMEAVWTCLRDSLLGNRLDDDVRPKNSSP